MLKLYLSLLYRPLKAFWTGIVLNVVGLVQLIVPKWLEGITPCLASVPWYLYVITGLVIWLLGSTWNAARIIRDLKKPVVDANIEMRRDSDIPVGGKTVFLQVANQEESDLKDCWCKVSSLEYKYLHGEDDKQTLGTDHRWLNMLVFANLASEELQWPSFEANAKKTIRAGDPIGERIDIASIENEALVFLFEKHPYSSLYGDGEYRLEIILGGVVDGRQIRPKIHRSGLDYNEENNALYIREW